MKIIDKANGTTVGEVMTNQSLTLDQAMSLSGYPWMEGEDDNTGYKVGDVYYVPNDLEMVY